MLRCGDVSQTFVVEFDEKNGVVVVVVVVVEEEEEQQQQQEEVVEVEGLEQW